MNSSLTPERRSEIMLSNITDHDCGVIAFQAITGRDRASAERLCRDKGSWDEQEGIPRGGLNLALMYAGYDLKPVSCHGDTSATFAVTHEYGVYLIYTEGHVAALVEGDLFNQRPGSHMPVEEAYRVTPQ